MGSSTAIKIGAAVVILGGGAIYSQIDGDAARVREAQKMADEGCACKTTACIDAVTQKFLAWTNKHGEEKVDDSDYKAVEDSANRLAACMTRVEGSDTTPEPAEAPEAAAPAETPPAADPAPAETPPPAAKAKAKKK
ncbi:MAG TPA: hypothetical protein VGM90_05240 [Kofleriaceae bacterium]|jgi:hypothetical protein